MKLKKSYLIPTVLAVLLLMTCEDYNWNNPNDPESRLYPNQWSPTEFTAEPITDSQIRLTWIQAVQPVEGFLLERKTTSSAWAELRDLDGEQTQYTDTALTVGVRYLYRICAYATGTDNRSTFILSDTTETTFLAPEPPTAIVESDNNILLEWNARYDYEEGYYIQRKEGFWGDWNTLDTLELDHSWYLDTDLSLGYYIYRVFAYTQWNRSATPDSVPMHIIERGTVMDIDSNIYRTVKIGDQWWMAENLRVTRYSNGDDIELGHNPIAWGGLTNGAYAFPEDNWEYQYTYGLLYNWFAASDSRGIAPEGWHVPTSDDWLQLEVYFGFPFDRTVWYWRGEEYNLGGNLKAVMGWQPPNSGAIDAVEFNALPAGYRSSNAAYGHFTSIAFYWTSTSESTPEAHFRQLEHDQLGIYHYYASKNRGYSIRCVKDD